jgi:RNA polymerase sigma-70 factor (ECF subfamily)
LFSPAARGRVKDEFADRLVELLPALDRYARSLTWDTDAGADLVQGVTLRALERRKQFVAGTDFEAWVITMARNLHLTNERSRLLHLDRDGEYCHLRQEPARPNQLDRLELNDVGRALEGLPAKQRKMVLLVALTGLRGAELARAVGTSHQAAHHRLTRGRERLRRLCA